MTALFPNRPAPEETSGAGEAAQDATLPLRLRVVAIRWESETIRSFDLALPEGGDLPAPEPGGHVDLALPGDLIRSYSLINGPEERACYRLAVHRDPASRGGSAHMCEGLRVGDLLDVTPARNTFPLAAGAAQSLFLAGGIGITPILSMIRHLDAAGRDWRLFYAVRDPAHAAFLPVLRALDAGRGRLALHVDSMAGGIADLAPVIASAAPGTHLYCCGPAPMITAFETATAGRAPEEVHLERFAGEAAAGAETGFTVMLKRSGREVAVAPGQTIMEALTEAGVRCAFSCRSGVCGTCETRVLSGTPDHRDNVLSERERASMSVMMICCSLSKTDRLVLDM